MSRTYGFVLLGRHPVEIELDVTTRCIVFKFYVANAVGLLQQVSDWNEQPAMRVCYVLHSLGDDGCLVTDQCTRYSGRYWITQ